MTSKSPKPRLPRKLDDVYIARLEQLGALNLDTLALAAELGCSVEELNKRKADDLDFNNALIRGRSKQVKNAAMIVVTVMSGQKLKDPTGREYEPSRSQYEAAKFYLEHTAPDWAYKE